MHLAPNLHKDQWGAKSSNALENEFAFWNLAQVAVSIFAGIIKKQGSLGNVYVFPYVCYMIHLKTANKHCVRGK